MLVVFVQPVVSTIVAAPDCFPRSKISCPASSPGPAPCTTVSVQVFGWGNLLGAMVLVMQLHAA